MNGSQFRGNINIFREHRRDIWGVVDADWIRLSCSWENELSVNAGILKCYRLYVGKSFGVREEIQNLGYQILGPTCREEKRWSVAGEKGRNLLTPATSNCSSMHTHAQRCTHAFVSVHLCSYTYTQPNAPTHRYSTCRTRVIVNLTGRFTIHWKKSIIFFSIFLRFLNN